jgi:hypothetical protein
MKVSEKKVERHRIPGNRWSMQKRRKANGYLPPLLHEESRKKERKKKKKPATLAPRVT